MVRIEELPPGLSLVGLESSGIATIAAVVPISDDSVQFIYKTGDGSLRDRLIGRTDEASLSIAEAERPWSFECNGEAFKLAVEAKRIDLAFLFDPMMLFTRRMWNRCRTKLPQFTNQCCRGSHFATSLQMIPVRAKPSWLRSPCVSS
jgi:hypothetical protein